MNYKALILSVAIFLFIPFWIFVILPQLPLYRANFSLSAQVASVDNFYDETKRSFQGEKTSKTIFTYEAKKAEDKVLLIKNTFDVRTLQGDKIFTVVRQYGVNPKTGKHIAGFGDRGRDGYLFGPRMKGLFKEVPEKADFTYWHINYDGPALMHFVAEEHLFGLTVYKYETNYKGVVIDQTSNLTHLPGVGQTRGVKLEPHLTVWIEPTGGRMVKYQDETNAYYYDLVTGQPLHPWNSFRNQIQDSSVQQLVATAYATKATIILQEIVFPLILFFLGVFFIVRKWMLQKGTWLDYSNLLFIVRAISVIIALSGVLVIYGWVTDNAFLIGVVPGFATMKFVTALAFIIASINLYLLTKLFDGNESLTQLFLPISTLTLSLLMVSVFISSVTGLQTGIENLFFSEPQESIKTVTPGRPSYGTISNFLLIIFVGISGIVAKKRLSKILIVSGVIISSIGLIAFFGYLLNIPELYFYSKDISSAMALNTALIFFFYGIAQIMLGRFSKIT